MQTKVHTFLGATLFMVTACGQKGDLYLPDPPPAAASLPTAGVAPEKTQILNSNAASVPPESAK